MPDPSDTRNTARTVAEIVEQSDYPGEAAARIAAALGVSFGDALALAEREIANG